MLQHLPSSTSNLKKVGNKDIARAFDQLTKLLELHDEDEFRIRSYKNAYLSIKKLDRPLANLSDTEIGEIKGIGKTITGKIRELLSKNSLKTLDDLRAKTPAGVVEMLEVRGFGPKKVRAVWQDMGIESIGELWYACNENRLIEFKGFGQKTQEDLKNRLEYFFKSRDKLLFEAAEAEADFAGALLSGRLPGAKIAAVGEVRRLCPVVEHIELLVAYDGDISQAFDKEVVTEEDSENATSLILEKEDGPRLHARLGKGTKLVLIPCSLTEFGSKMFQYTGSRAFLEAFVRENPGVDFKNLDSEAKVFEKAGLAFLPPERRENPEALALAKTGQIPKRIEETDIRGVLHVHTNWSDGIHSLRDMCAHVRDLGYAYIGITDHSQSAFYANGLKPERVLAQMAEIDALNAEFAPFRIYKGIESDILNDGSLDYEPEILEKFDFVIASVHSNLKMTREKATERMLRAIANPFTTILGHPTSRLLLSREGYPLDWDAIFDACAQHGVAIELNANPHRLDLDWSLIPEARRRGIQIAINPDAHSREGVQHIRYGVLAAQKGGLTAEGCFNCGDFLTKKRL